MRAQPYNRLACIPRDELENWWLYIQNPQSDSVDDITEDMWKSWLNAELDTQTVSEKQNMVSILKTVKMDPKYTNHKDRIRDFTKRFTQKAREISAFQALLAKPKTHIQLLTAGISPTKVRSKMFSLIKQDDTIKTDLKAFMELLDMELEKYCTVMYDDKRDADASQESRDPRTKPTREDSHDSRKKRRPHHPSPRDDDSTREDKRNGKDQLLTEIRNLYISGGQKSWSNATIAKEIIY